MNSRNRHRGPGQGRASGSECFAHFSCCDSHAARAIRQEWQNQTPMAVSIEQRALGGISHPASRLGITGSEPQRTPVPSPCTHGKPLSCQTEARPRAGGTLVLSTSSRVDGKLGMGSNELVPCLFLPVAHPAISNTVLHELPVSRIAEERSEHPSYRTLQTWPCVPPIPPNNAAHPPGPRR